MNPNKETNIEKTGWNTTNRVEVNWIQRGNVIQVHLQTISGFPTGTTALTGLPKPMITSTTALARPIASGDAIHPIGYISYNVATHGWAIHIPTETTGTISFFDEFIYLTDE